MSPLAWGVPLAAGITRERTVRIEIHEKSEIGPGFC